MDNIIKNLMFLSSRVGEHKALEYIAPITSTLGEIISLEGDVVSEVASNLRFAFLDAGVDSKEPTVALISNVVKDVLEAEGFLVERGSTGFKASRGSELLLIKASSLIRGKEIYSDTLKFRKVAAIMPDMKFVKTLAKQAFDVLVRVKPKNVSKCLAGIIHTMFFDYAMDKNIFLTSSFYHELRQGYLPEIKAALGVDEIRYYATGPDEKKLASIISVNLDSPKTHLNLFKSAKKAYASLSERNLCDRLLVMSELLGFGEEKVMSLASSLSKFTKLEFNFAEV